MSELPAAFERIRNSHSQVLTIVSPPRCSSTAFARVLWENATVRYYSHEPFETTYYRDAPIDDAADRLASPLDLAPYARASHGDTLVIKEMPYQAGPNFPVLAALATPPLIFLLHDPRISIASRMKRKIQVGDSPLFPKIESGWQLIAEQIRYCRDVEMPLVVVDASDFRNHSEAVFSDLLPRFGLTFSADMLEWRPCSEVDLDNLEGAHSHLYRQVLRSTGLLPATEPPPEMDHFPATDGFRDHVAWCLEVYRELLESPERIRVPEPAEPDTEGLRLGS